MRRTAADHDAAHETARLLLEIGAVNLRPEDPYALTSGWRSPAYVDCRRIIYFPRARARIMDLACAAIGRHFGLETLEAVAGGETAGIPFAAWIAERMGLPMAYVRKKPKGFGRGARIEGDVPVGRATLLVEDLASDGGSKVGFTEALREAGARCEHGFVVFSYGVFPGADEAMARLGLRMLHLCGWADVLSACEGMESSPFPAEALAETRRFLAEPMAWSRARGGVGSLEEAAVFKAGRAG